MFHSSVPGPMPAPLTQYLFRVMRRPNLAVRFIVYISHIIPVYINQIRSRCHLELSRDVPVIAQKGRVQESTPYHLSYVIIVSHSRNYFVLLPLRIRIAPKIKDRIQFPQDLERYPSLGGTYLGTVQGPEQTSCKISCTTLPPHLHIICCRCLNVCLLHTRFFILLCPSPPLF